MNPLIEAIKNENLNQLRLLIELGHDVNVEDEEGNSLLHIAVKSSTPIKLIRFIIESGANVNAEDEHGNTSLVYAAESNSKDAAELLISHNANTNILEYSDKYWFFPSTDYDKNIFWVAKWLNPTWLYICIQNISDINITDKSGESLLFHAYHEIESVRILLDAGINVNIRNHKGETALTHANRIFEGKDAGLVHLLIDHGAVE